MIICTWQWIRNRELHGWTRSWLSFHVVSRYFTGATKENHEEHQSSRWCGGDSNRGLPECKWSVIAWSILLRLPCVLWFETCCCVCGEREREGEENNVWPDIHRLVVSAGVWVTITWHLNLETYSCFILCLFIDRDCVCLLVLLTLLFLKHELQTTRTGSICFSVI
jgi:hypothetical protein